MKKWIGIVLAMSVGSCVPEAAIAHKETYSAKEIVHIPLDRWIKNR